MGRPRIVMTGLLQGTPGRDGTDGINGASVGSGLPSVVVSKTTTYTAAINEFVRADTTSAGFTVTLPTNPAVGALVAVKKVSSDTNTLTIAPAGGGTIDGDANATTITENAGLIVEHAGSNVWNVIASMSTTGPAGADGADAALSTIQDEGSSLTQRSTMNFTGAGVTVTDAGGKTVVTIPGGGGGSGRPYRSGRVTTPTSTVSPLAMGSGYEYVMPFDVVGSSITVTDIGINVTTGQVGGAVRLGVRADSSGSPGAVILSAAADIDASTTGFKETTFSTTLAVGSYWLCARATGGAGAEVSANTGVPFVLASVGVYNGSSSPITGYSDNGGGSGALSGSYTPTYLADKAPRVMLKTT